MPTVKRRSGSFGFLFVRLKRSRTKTHYRYDLGRILIRNADLVSLVSFLPVIVPAFVNGIGPGK
jgi:hypothetical protein